MECRGPGESDRRQRGSGHAGCGRLRDRSLARLGRGARNPGDFGRPDFGGAGRLIRSAALSGKTSCYRRLMRTTGTVTISLAPELAVEVDRLARQEGRTRSELLREAFRQYAERRRRWDQLFAYGTGRAAAGALTEDSVVAAVKSRRSRSRGKPTR